MSLLILAHKFWCNEVMLLHFHEYNKPLMVWPKLNISRKKKKGKKKKKERGIGIIRNSVTFNILRFRKH